MTASVVDLASAQQLIHGIEGAPPYFRIFGRRLEEHLPFQANLLHLSEHSKSPQGSEFTGTSLRWPV